MKLTRATIPMCPNCGAELPSSHHYYEGPCLVCKCPGCSITWVDDDWDYGYHAPDIDAIREVVRRMRATVFDICSRSGQVSTAVVADWATDLESAIKEGQE